MSHPTRKQVDEDAGGEDDEWEHGGLAVADGADENYVEAGKINGGEPAEDVGPAAAGESPDAEDGEQDDGRVGE